MIPDEILAGFYYLSCIEDDSIAQAEADILEKNLYFIPDQFKQWFSWFLDYHKNYAAYPVWSKVKSQMGLERDMVLSAQEAKSIHDKNMALWESDFLAGKLMKVPLVERRDVLIKLSNVLSADTQSSYSLASISDFKVDEAIIKKESGGKQFFSMFTQHLDTQCIVNPGTVISILGGPGMGKSMAALNLVYLNSVLDGLNSLYIYLENTTNNYNIELMARHSYTNGMLVENATMKRGVDPEESVAVKRIHDLQESLMNDRKGDVFFAPFSKFNPEPLRFANQLGKYVDEHNIQVVVVDYLQRCKSFTPLKWDSREYINQVMSAFSSAALGNFGSTPFVGVMLSQLTRAAEEKWLKTKGVGMTIYDSVEAPSIERDSFIVIGIYADPELRSNQNMVYKLLKNRDLAADVGTVLTTALPQYCYIGDMHSGQSVPTFSQEDARVLLDIF